MELPFSILGEGENFVRSVYLYCEERKVTAYSFIAETSGKVHKKIMCMLKLILQTQYPLCEPYVKHFSVERYKNLYELRLRADGRMVRIIYTIEGESLILLHAFYKHNKRDTERALEYALKLQKNMDVSHLQLLESLLEVNA